MTSAKSHSDFWSSPHSWQCPHSAVITQQLLEQFKWDVFENPAYRPDLATSDFHLFPELKNRLGGQSFKNNDRLQSWGTDWASLGEGARWFKKLSSPHCACGLVGDADHYVFRCPVTAEFHSKEPSDEHRKSWFKNLRYNGQTQTKLTQAFKISNGICDRLTRG
ncbi:hypothetical protein AVEN_181444-1 [Araneus ventricosus]|uniref:Uncharacterized protein n=1 Tax=Araneus ventricosus TaxID=182803 RepID=A0A4Y2SUR7_ARAVE|nr:hypothetical protein AVEN_181444-1 [Araneus ventricosus]